MHPYDESVEWIKTQHDVAEARSWLEDAGNDYGVIHELSREETREVVEAAYDSGATKVQVVGRIPPDPSKSSVDMLLIILPEESESRGELFDLEAKVAKETGFDSSIDEGQNYILLRWT